MKRVIDISEEDYNEIEPFLNGEKIKGGFNLYGVLEMILNSTPLPEMHGIKFLFTYAYKGRTLGKPETGEGSMEITLHGSDKVTPKEIKTACDIVRKDLEDKGIYIDLIAPMGWFKYDGYDEELGR